jgi:hypothetical protein
VVTALTGRPSTKRRSIWGGVAVSRSSNTPWRIQRQGQHIFPGETVPNRFRRLRIGQAFHILEDRDEGEADGRGARLSSLVTEEG